MMQTVKLIILIFILTGCSKQSDEKAFRVGYAIEVPYSYVDKSGNPVGQSIELTLAVTERLGLTPIAWHLMPFDQLLPSLASKEIDMIATNLFITSARQQRFIFSSPTAWACLGEMSLKGGSNNDDAAAYIVLNGSAEHDILKRYAAEHLLVVHSVELARQALDEQRGKAIVLSMPSLHQLANRNLYQIKLINNSKVVSQLALPMGFVLHPASGKLAERINQTLADLPPLLLERWPHFFMARNKEQAQQICQKQYRDK